MNKRLVITGAGGFIGQALIKCARDSYSVVAVDRRPVNGNPPIDWQPKTIKEIVRRGDTVVHLAHGWSLTDNRNLKSLPAALRGQDLRLRSIRWILRRLSKRHPLRSIVRQERAKAKALKIAQPRWLTLVSSAAVYKPVDHPVTENTALAPRNMYGLSKVLIEKIYQEKFSKTLGVVRVFNVYGPGQLPNRGGSFVVTTLKNIQERKTVTLNGDGSQLRDPVYVTDVAQAIFLVTKRRRPAAVNVGSGRPVTIMRLVTLLARNVGWPAKINYASNRPDQSFVADIRLLRNLGWQPRTRLSAGLRSLMRKPL